MLEKGFAWSDFYRLIKRNFIWKQPCSLCNLHNNTLKRPSLMSLVSILPLRVLLLSCYLRPRSRLHHLLLHRPLHHHRLLLHHHRHLHRRPRPSSPPASSHPKDLRPAPTPRLLRHQVHASSAEPADILHTRPEQALRIRRRIPVEDIRRTVAGRRSPAVGRRAVDRILAAGRILAGRSRPADRRAIAEAGCVSRLVLTKIHQCHPSWPRRGAAVAADRSSATATAHTRLAHLLGSSYRSPRDPTPRSLWDVRRLGHVRLLRPVVVGRNERLRRGSDGSQRLVGRRRDCWSLDPFRVGSCCHLRRLGRSSCRRRWYFLLQDRRGVDQAGHRWRRGRQVRLGAPNWIVWCGCLRRTCG